jgi:8-oxo-dGTP pyrophosphatase MutT (NUDIX family)
MREHEILVVVLRGDETLVLHRAPAGGGYWHLVAGGVEPGETPAEAAARELAEEVGLQGEVVPLAYRFDYVPTPEERLRREFGAAVAVDCFEIEAPVGWEPVLDSEHDEYRWCSVAEAVALLYWPEPRIAVETAVSRS